MNNKDLPAMPLTGDAYTELSKHLRLNITLDRECLGLTKREMFAKEAMQGLLANKYTGDPANFDTPQEWVKNLAEAAVEFADATLDELARTSNAE